MTQPTWFRTLQREFEPPVMSTVPFAVDATEDTRFILVMAGVSFDDFIDGVAMATRADEYAAAQFEMSCERAGL